MKKPNVKEAKVAGGRRKRRRRRGGVKGKDSGPNQNERALKALKGLTNIIKLCNFQKPSLFEKVRNNKIASLPAQPKFLDKMYFGRSRRRPKTMLSAFCFKILFRVAFWVEIKLNENKKKKLLFIVCGVKIVEK